MTRSIVNESHGGAVTCGLVIVYVNSASVRRPECRTTQINACWSPTIQTSLRASRSRRTFRPCRLRGTCRDRYAASAWRCRNTGRFWPPTAVTRNRAIGCVENPPERLSRRVSGRLGTMHASFANHRVICRSCCAARSHIAVHQSRNQILKTRQGSADNLDLRSPPRAQVGLADRESPAICERL